jgi:uncharacterized protein (TIGR02679 family)
MARRVELAEDPQLRPVWAAVHERLCRGEATARSVITIRDASPEVRRALDRLLGRVSTSGQLSVRLGALDDVLGRTGIDARSVAEQACGAIVDRAAERAAREAERDADWSAILGHPAAEEPAVAAWLDRIRIRGALARSGGRDSVLRALDVLEVLPRQGTTVGRSVLAAALVGDEHALDDGTDLERLVTSGLAARAGAERPTSAADRAALWAASSVTFDTVSAPALTFALRPLAVGPLTEAAARWADAGVPLPVPAAALAAETWHVPSGTDVFVCENPSVVEAAAAKLGKQCPPLVCVSGVPGRAVSALLAQLAGGGALLRYHGDFGTGGIVIANLVITRHGATPWRMSTDDHRRAAERLAAAGTTPARLRGRVLAASWDPELAPAIVAYGYEITEEHVLGDLLEDLGQR